MFFSNDENQKRLLSAKYLIELGDKLNSLSKSVDKSLRKCAKNRQKTQSLLDSLPIQQKMTQVLKNFYLILGWNETRSTVNTHTRRVASSLKFLTS